MNKITRPMMETSQVIQKITKETNMRDTMKARSEMRPRIRTKMRTHNESTDTKYEFIAAINTKKRTMKVLCSRK